MDDKVKTASELLYRTSIGCILVLILVKLAVLVGLGWVAWHFISKYW